MPKKKTAQSTSKKNTSSQGQSQEEHFESFHDTSNALIDSMNGLSKTLNSMMNLFDRATESMAQEEQGQSMVSENFGPLVNKVNTILDQNNKIAQGMVTILEQIEETKKEQDAKIEQLHSLLTKQTTSQTQEKPSPQPGPIKPEPQFKQPSFGQPKQPQPSMAAQQQQQNPFQNQPSQQSFQNPNDASDDFKMDDLFNNYPPQHTGNQQQTQRPQQPQPPGTPQMQQHQTPQQQRPNPTPQQQQNPTPQQQQQNPTPLNDMPPIDPYATQNPQLKKTDLSSSGQQQQNPQQTKGSNESKKPLFKSLFKNK